MAKLFTLEAKLDQVRPSIWRTFEFPGRYSLKRLHSLLQILFGWNDSHLHEFEIYGILYADPDVLDLDFGSGERDEAAHLEDLVKKGSRFFYRYDLGDDWQVNLKVLDHRPLQAEDRPICLDGKRAGPLDDCGGVSGYRKLTKVLTRPGHPEHGFLRQWAGRWNPEEFDLGSLNKKLERKFPPSKGKAPAHLLDVKIGQYLVVKLNIRQQMAAALLEKGSAMTLEEIAQRLQQAGTILPAGVTSLRRAWRRLPPLRETLEGQLELETYHPAFKDLASELERHQPRTPVPRQTTLKPQLPDPNIAISAALLREALVSGRPAKLSNRRLLLLVLNSFGGKASLENVLERVALIAGYPLTATDIRLSLRGQSCMRLRDGELSLESGHEDLRKARLCFLQWWSPLQAARQERSCWPERTERRKQERERGYREVAQRFLQADKAILSYDFDNDQLAVGLLSFPSHKGVVYSANQGEQLKAALSRLDLVVGLDAKRIYERLGVMADGKTFIDVTPPGVPAGTAPNDPTLVGALQDTVPARWPQGVSCDALLGRARVLHAYYAFGVRHGYVLRKRRSSVQETPVRWNLGLEIPLYSALKFCVETECAVRISVKPQDPLNPLEWEMDFQPQQLGRDGVRGRWANSGRQQTLDFSEIYSFSGDFGVPFTCFAFYQ